MEKKKKISFKLPETIKHKEARKIISDLVKQLNDRGQLEIADIPQLHRMATAYDAYLECVEVLAQDGMTMKNLKGECVKRPEANLLKENWSQYLELAKEYGCQYAEAPTGEMNEAYELQFFQTLRGFFYDHTMNLSDIFRYCG